MSFNSPLRPEQIGQIDPGPDRVSLRELKVLIPTYVAGTPDKNPLFLEKRVYQGSSGRVYPFPVIETISDEKTDQEWTILVLENRWTQYWIMPELGGRIQRALDKTNQYDFVYYNRVIKPALVGLAGPWISGGIEFNWPQHHRPSTYLPLAYKVENLSDGSSTVFLSETDRMYGTKVLAGMTLRPDSSWIEIKVKLSNRTPMPQTFLWWANPAVAVHDQTQSIFPPDVHAVYDHGKRDVSSFPIAKGTYYKIDYSAGVDISWYKNIPVPTSYMVHHSEYDFVGHYDHRSQAGLLHYADHHVSPGKKQWTWGTGEFGKAWERNLTDEDGPYIELMTGVFTDNQPDFTWLEPYEEKSFVQYFMPVKGIGVVRNANRDWFVSADLKEKKLRVGVGVARISYGLTVEIFSGGDVVYSVARDLDPSTPWIFELDLDTEVSPDRIRVKVRNNEGKVLETGLEFPSPRQSLPEPAKAIPSPKEIGAVDLLYWSGQHLEQYRHATFEPEDYYREGLVRDPDDFRMNTALGILLLRRGDTVSAEVLLRKACKTAQRYNPNPSEGSAFFHLATILRYTGRNEEAFDLFFKATWSQSWQGPAYFELARLAALSGNFAGSLDFVRQCLQRNLHHMKARHLEIAVLRRTNAQSDRIAACLSDGLKIDPLDPGLCAEWCFFKSENADELLIHGQEPYSKILENRLGNASYLVRELCADYLAMGDWTTAKNLAGWGHKHTIRAEAGQSADPFLAYYFIEAKRREASVPESELKKDLVTAASQSPDWCFANRIEDLFILERACLDNPSDGLARYALGNFFYDRKQPRKAVSYWEEAARLLPEFATVRRNLALAYFNKFKDAVQARTWLEEASRLDPADARIAFEFDQLRKKTGVGPAERWKTLQRISSLWMGRDDFCVEALTVLNNLGRWDEVLGFIATRRFHPWEGGEGKVVRQYIYALVQRARKKLDEGDPAGALVDLDAALVYPESLGEGKLQGARDHNIYYWRGVALDRLGLREEAIKVWKHNLEGDFEPAGMMYYNDQPPEMIWYQGLSAACLDRIDKASELFAKLADWGEKHRDDPLSIDYFAVSFPDFLIFEEDLNQRNRNHCLYLMALGEEGFRRIGRPGRFPLEPLIEEILAEDPNNQGVHEQWPLMAEQ